MWPEINQDIGTITGTTTINTTVMGHREGIAEIRTERIHDIVLFQAITACAGLIGMKNTVASEAIGITVGFISDENVFTVLTGGVWRTEIAMVLLPTMLTYVGGIGTFEAHVFSSLMDTYLWPSTFHALATYFLVLTDIRAGTGNTPLFILSMRTDSWTATWGTTGTAFSVFAHLFPLTFGT